MKLRFLVVYEFGKETYSATAQDLPFCAASAASLEVAQRTMRDTVRNYLAHLAAEGSDIPRPTTTVVAFPRPTERPNINHWVVEWMEV